jgi:signal transduction histidine kinase
MRERVTAAGGTLRIHSYPGEGTTLKATFPLLAEGSPTPALEVPEMVKRD